MSDWRDRAACKGATDLFFDDAPRVNKEAARVCNACPIQAECLVHAIKTSEEQGVWGGLSKDQRKRFRALVGKGAWWEKPCEMCAAPMVVTTANIRRVYCDECSRQAKTQNTHRWRVNRVRAS